MADWKTADQITETACSSQSEKLAAKEFTWHLHQLDEWQLGLHKKG